MVGPQQQLWITPILLLMDVSPRKSIPKHPTQKVSFQPISHPTFGIMSLTICTTVRELLAYNQSGGSAKVILVNEKWIQDSAAKKALLDPLPYMHDKSPIPAKQPTVSQQNPTVVAASNQQGKKRQRDVSGKKVFPSSKKLTSRARIRTAWPQTTMLHPGRSLESNRIHQVLSPTLFCHLLEDPSQTPSAGSGKVVVVPVDPACPISGISPLFYINPTMIHSILSGCCWFTWRSIWCNIESDKHSNECKCLDLICLTVEEQQVLLHPGTHILHLSNR